MLQELFKIIDFLKNYELWGNTAWSYTLTILVFIGSIIILKFFQVIILSKLKKLAKKTKTDVDDMLVEIFSKIRPPFYFLFSMFIALRYLNFSGIANKILFVSLVVVVTFEIAEAFSRFVDFYINKYISQSDRDDGDKKQAQAMMRILKGFAIFIIWALAILIVLSNLGINVTSLVASMGIGGIAIALAVQNILGDVLSSFSIFIDKPFQVGDNITVGTNSGTVEKIGLKTTRIRTLRGEELVVSNKELTTVRVQNMKRLKKRRDLFKLGIAYETPKTKLKKIPGMIKKIVSANKLAEFDRCHFVEYGDYSLNFEIVYYVDTDSYKKFLDIKQKINLDIFAEFEKEGIVFAYPTQVVYVEKGE